MRTSRLMLLFLAGCTPFQAFRMTPADDAAAMAESIGQARQIVIDYGSWAKHGGRSSARWILERDGTCTCETTSCDAFMMHHGQSSNGKTTPDQERWSLPPETFREAQRLLMESKLWTVKERRQPEFESGERFTVEWDGHRESFNYTPAEAKRLMAYLNRP